MSGSAPPHCPPAARDVLAVPRLRVALGLAVRNEVDGFSSPPAALADDDGRRTVLPLAPPTSPAGLGDDAVFSRWPDRAELLRRRRSPPRIRIRIWCRSDISSGTWSAPRRTVPGADEIPVVETLAGSCTSACYWPAAADRRHVPRSWRCAARRDRTPQARESSPPAFFAAARWACDRNPSGWRVRCRDAAERERHRDATRKRKVDMTLHRDPR